MTSEYCVLNGELIKTEDACISPFDRGFMYGDGIFDTMYAPKGVPFLFNEHMGRLFDNLRRMEITLSRSPDEMRGIITALITRNGLVGIDSFIRTTVTRGVNKGGMFYPSDEPTLFIFADEVPEGLDEIREKGRRCVTASFPKSVKNPVYGVKSLNFLWSIMGMGEAFHAGADECIFFNSNGHLAEGSTSNVFVVTGHEIATPGDESGILPGVTRDYLITLLEEEGIHVMKKDITRDALFASDEVFLTGSLRGVVPVTSIDGHEFKTVYSRDIQSIYFNSLKSL
jgi:branched-subunit amino acid aminotransferase/4-amino-4-deoxychorismate lyase